MKPVFKLIAILLLVVGSCKHVFAQQAQVFDAETRQPLPFATIKFGKGEQGMVTDINGRFDMAQAKGFPYIEVCYMGFESYKIIMPVNTSDLQIWLKTDHKSLKDVIISPPYDKIRRIINEAIAHRSENNPDLYDWYRCHIYYKMTADDQIQDSFIHKNTIPTKPGKIHPAKQLTCLLYTSDAADE